MWVQCSNSTTCADVNGKPSTVGDTVCVSVCVLVGLGAWSAERSVHFLSFRLKPPLCFTETYSSTAF